MVTFTNKAADEMKKRLRYLIGDKNTESLIIGTFHAICCRILHQYAKIVDLDPSFAVADTDKSKDIIKQLRKNKQLNISNFTRIKMKEGMLGKFSSNFLFKTDFNRCNLWNDKQSKKRW